MARQLWGARSGEGGGGGGATGGGRASLAAGAGGQPDVAAQAGMMSGASSGASALADNVAPEPDNVGATQTTFGEYSETRDAGGTEAGTRDTSQDPSTSQSPSLDPDAMTEDEFATAAQENPKEFARLVYDENQSQHPQVQADEDGRAAGRSEAPFGHRDVRLRRSSCP